MNENEIWRDIEGYEGLYQVSNLGKVKSVAEKKSKRVFQYHKNGLLVAIWLSTAECGRQGFDQGHIAECCRGERKYYNGYIWSYTPL